METKTYEGEPIVSTVMATSDDSLLKHFNNVRNLTELLCKPLEIEDFAVQPVVDVSPPKWHLAHTTWFFEEIILKNNVNKYREFNKKFGFLFNSYYESLGERTLRPERGNLTRPTVEEILKYRKYVNTAMCELISSNKLSQDLQNLIILGLNHEQQHQELLVTDLKYILGHNPLFPVYSGEKENIPAVHNTGSKSWIELEEGVYEIGYNGKRFHYDNEEGRHKTYIHACRLMDRLVTNGEYLEFMDAGGYENFQWWLSDGWDWINHNEIKAPLYWYKEEDRWMQYKLAGLKDVNEDEPLTHISFYEAEAFCQWKGKRLPTEFEWEALAQKDANPVESGTFLDDRRFHPMARKERSNQMLGDVWEWTNSAYLPYPYFTRASGAVGEYNGKFMVNQKVLRGGSCATPRDHIRLTYRNFFHPHLRWQFNGIRLAETLI